MAIADTKHETVVARGAISSGPGYLAGQAPGIVTVDGVASSRIVEVRHRVNRITIDSVRSDENGLYAIYGVDPTQEFDVISIDWSNVYNDIIVSRVRPIPYDIQSVTGDFDANSVSGSLDGFLVVFGGAPPFDVSVSGGTEPPGITYEVVVGSPPIYDDIGRYVVASGTTSAGSYSWTLKITAANGSSKSIALNATFT